MGGLRLLHLGAIALLVFALGGVALAQSQSQLERELSQARTDSQRKLDDEARARKSADDVRKSYRDQGEVDQIRKQAEAADEVFRAERRTRLEQQSAAATESRRQQVLSEAAMMQRQAQENEPYRQAAVLELASRPAPFPTPGSFTECDRLAASAADETRPLGLEGVDSNQINAALAIPACTAEVARDPKSARAKFELGRSQVAGGLCREGQFTLYDAYQLGSSAAHLSMSYGAADVCISPHPYEPQIIDAFAEGNATAGSLIVLQENERFHGREISGSQSEPIASQAARVIQLIRPRANAGDTHAIYVLAAMAALPLQKHPIADDERKKWVFRCIARGVKQCEQFSSVGWNSR